MSQILYINIISELQNKKMAQSNIGPPPGYNQYTEMQDPGEYSYPGDKKGLVPNDGR